MGKVVEIHYTIDVHIDYRGYGDYETETQWYIKRILYKKFLFFWFKVTSQKLRMDTNQAIHSGCFGTVWDYSHFWKLELSGVPDKVIYK